MSRRALEESAVNLGQGFPDYPVDPRLSQALIETIAEGRNQYAPMEGVVDLRAAIANKLQVSYARTFDPESEITVTCGGTEALYDSIQAVVRAGEFVIVPKGVEHCPVADEEVHIVLIEPKSTLNTGNITNERTVAQLERI